MADEYSSGQIFGIVTLILFIGGLIGYFLNYISGLAGYAYPRGPATKSVVDQLSGYTGSKALLYFLPYSLFLFGVMNDAINKELKYSPGSFIGFLMVLLNSGMSYLITGVTTMDTDTCGIPSMKQSGSRIMPQNILYSSVVTSYIAATVNTLNPESSQVAIAGVFIVGVIQTILFYANNCGSLVVDGIGWKGTFGVSLMPAFWALLVGGSVGGLSGTLIAKSLPKKEDSSAVVIQSDPVDSAIEKVKTELATAKDKVPTNIQIPGTTPGTTRTATVTIPPTTTTLPTVTTGGRTFAPIANQPGAFIGV